MLRLVPRPQITVKSNLGTCKMAKLTAPLGRRAVAAIHKAVADLFARARIRLIGRDWLPRQIVVGPTSVVEHRHDLSLPGVFDASSSSEGFRPREEVRDAVTRAASTYLDAYEARARAAAVDVVEAHVRRAAHAGKDADPSKVRSELLGHLAGVMATATKDVERMVETEVTAARNVGALDGIVKVNVLSGIDDPVIAFASVNDKHRCDECTTLHTLSDGITPRAWLLSEVEAGWHQRGSGRPSMKGIHPRCRCSMFTILPGWGFEGGRLAYIKDGFNEIARQRL